MRISEVLAENIFTCDYHSVMGAVAKLYKDHYDVNIWEFADFHDDAAKVLMKNHPSQVDPGQTKLWDRLIQRTASTLPVRPRPNRMHVKHYAFYLFLNPHGSFLWGLLCCQSVRATPALS